ncbi:transporter substrate-binding domain-containing protein [Acuticoccus sp. MNP-M23]|uniref:transporter substrate-binding domain-containing protein n=1 Tax=Acuticoccus sp. MNP-M23 TaxID=3072793 RepID=UPI0028160C35|nr:transporter substrate-binding domain-containing protein [Acuticoccus sp. MNP-M23]WMS44237.1 transporter substrate-binding domain-containing protein [Acuticoccus sp. MNP-M23]
MRPTPIDSISRLACLLVAAILLALPAHAQSPAPAAEPQAQAQAPANANASADNVTVRTGPLKVGAAQRPPFAAQGADGSWQGIGIDLWRMVAEDTGLPYEITPITRDGLHEALRSGEIDVAIALDATPENAEGVSFTMPFYTATLGVVSEVELSFFRVLKNLATRELLNIVISLSALLLVVGGIIWLVERRHNEDQFAHGAARGLGDGFWWAGVTLTTIGYGDKAPQSFIGRAVAMLWMLVGLAVSAALTASVVSATNIGSAQTLNVPSDLTDHRVAVQEGGSAEAYLKNLGITLVPEATLDDALAAIAADKADAAAAAAPTLRVAMDKVPSDLILSTTTQDPQYVTIATRADLAPAEQDAIDRAVLKAVTSDGWWSLVDRYLPGSN